MAVFRTSEDFEQYEWGGFRKIFRKKFHVPLFKIGDKIYRNKSRNLEIFVLVIEIEKN